MRHYRHVTGIRVSRCPTISFSYVPPSLSQGKEKSMSVWSRQDFPPRPARWHPRQCHQINRPLFYCCPKPGLCLSPMTDCCSFLMHHSRDKGSRTEHSIPKRDLTQYHYSISKVMQTVCCGVVVASNQDHPPNTAAMGIPGTWKLLCRWSHSSSFCSQNRGELSPCLVSDTFPIRGGEGGWCRPLAGKLPVSLLAGIPFASWICNTGQGNT